jgi:hypothetical protein
MDSKLTVEGESYLQEILRWDARRRQVEGRLSQAVLLLGGLLIAGTALFTLGHLRDEVILTILVPGFLTGLFLIGIHVLVSRRVRDRHLMASLLRNLTERV